MFATIVILLIVFGLPIIALLSGAFAIFEGSSRAATRKEELEGSRIRELERQAEDARRKWLREHGAGEIGEKIVADVFSQIDPMMQIFRSVYIPIKNNGYTEVDLIGVHPTGIYVVESKNYRGVIVGTEEDENWNQAFIEKNHTFYNPIKQNTGHVEAIRDHLGKMSEGIPFYSVIVFGDQCNIDLINWTSPNVYITKHRLLNETLKNIMVQTNRTLSEALQTEIVETLLPLTDVSDEIKEEHLAYVQMKKNNIDASA